MTATTSTSAATTPTGATSATTTTVNYPGANANLTGTGSTFVLPAMSDWAQRYNQLYSGVKVNYQGTGSGNGKTQFLANTVDFAGTDSPFSDSDYEKAGGPDKAMHIPVVMGGVVMAYNVPGVTTQLKLDGTTIANIYLLKITNWNDPAIAALNSGVTLPDLPIAVVHRSDSSGTTDIFTDYLSKVSADWKSQVGRGTAVQWPGGIGGQGNDGVSQLVKQTSGGIGYIELAYAKQNSITYALVKNQAGNFMDATTDSVSEAANSSISTLPADLRYSITNAPGTNAYPIAGTTWLLVYVAQTDATKGKSLAYFIWWITHDGQQFSQKLYYAPLPTALVSKDESQVKRMMCGSSPCFP
jgi:phosphate transport system substrate-binding protein